MSQQPSTHVSVPAAAPVECIGECDLCGLVDHHLVLGACPKCNGHHRLLIQSQAPGVPTNAGTAGQE